MMKKIILFLCLVLSLFGADDSGWGQLNDKDFTVNFVSSYENNLNQFGFIKEKEICKATLMYLTLHSDDKRVEKFNNKFVKLDLETKYVKFTIEISIQVFKEAFPGSDISYVLISTNFIMSDEFIDLLKNSKTIEVSISPHQEIAKYFKERAYLFNLRGFEKAYKLGYNRCIKQSKKPKVKRWNSYMKTKIYQKI